MVRSFAHMPLGISDRNKMLYVEKNKALPSTARLAKSALDRKGWRTVAL